MIVYRITRERYAQDLSGTGARLYGGRWNPKGTALLYTAESRALAAMELAVHTDLNDLPDDLQLVTLELPADALVYQVNPFEHWDKHPPDLSTKMKGDHFVSQGKQLVMQVPSVVIRGDHNCLINPAHEQFKSIKTVDITPFFFDERLSSEGK